MHWRFKPQCCASHASPTLPGPTATQLVVSIPLDSTIAHVCPEPQSCVCRLHGMTGWHTGTVCELCAASGWMSQKYGLFALFLLYVVQDADSQQ